MVKESKKKSVKSSGDTTKQDKSKKVKGSSKNITKKDPK